jgi:Fe-S cluster assembly iron-binding protein IscA
MFEVSLSATQALAAYLKEQGLIDSPVRITPMAGNCAGPHLRLRTGEIKKTDQVFHYDGITFVINQELLAECGEIRMEYIESANPCCCSSGCAGFRINGKKKYPFSGRCTLSPEHCDGRCGTLKQG